MPMLPPDKPLCLIWVTLAGRRNAFFGDPLPLPSPRAILTVGIRARGGTQGPLIWRPEPDPLMPDMRTMIVQAPPMLSDP